MSIESKGTIGSQYVGIFALQRLEASLKMSCGTHFSRKFTLFGGPTKNFRPKPPQTIYFLVYYEFFYNPVKSQQDRSVFGVMSPKKVIEILIFDYRWLNWNLWEAVADSIFNIFKIRKNPLVALFMLLQGDDVRIFDFSVVKPVKIENCKNSAKIRQKFLEKISKKIVPNFFSDRSWSQIKDKAIIYQLTPI